MLPFNITQGALFQQKKQKQLAQRFIGDIAPENTVNEDNKSESALKQDHVLFIQSESLLLLLLLHELLEDPWDFRPRL